MTLEYDHLLHKQFRWGEQDCFSLVRDFYARNFKIQITNYARPTNWSSDQMDLMRILPEREGFEQISNWKLKDLRPADVLCMAIGESNPNHFAVYLGDGRLVHHLYGRNSSEEEFRGFWRNRVSFILRHPDVPDLRPVYPDVDIMDILNARNTPKPD